MVVLALLCLHLSNSWGRSRVTRSPVFDQTVHFWCKVWLMISLETRQVKEEEREERASGTKG